MSKGLSVDSDASADNTTRLASRPRVAATDTPDPERGEHVKSLVIRTQ